MHLLSDAYSSGAQEAPDCHCSALDPKAELLAVDALATLTSLEHETTSIITRVAARNELPRYTTSL
jgi:hypothetical protein